MNPVRHTSYTRGELTIGNEYGPLAEGIRHSTVNGKYIATPKLEVCAAIVEKLPFY